jgi:hypothetical protein
MAFRGVLIIWAGILDVSQRPIANRLQIANLHSMASNGFGLRILRETGHRI